MNTQMYKDNNAAEGIQPCPLGITQAMASWGRMIDGYSIHRTIHYPPINDLSSTKKEYNNHPCLQIFFNSTSLTYDIPSYMS
jgi:hypothetical protein